jgi:L-asparagine transporter-like permease
MIFNLFFLVMVTLINCYSVRVSSKINSVFSIGKILALILIIVFGVINLSKGITRDLIIY